MKKLLSTLLLIGMLVFVSFSPSAINKKDPTDLNLKGKVKTLTETMFKAVDKFGEIQKGEIQGKDIILFNDKGNRIEYNYYNSDDGRLSENDIFKYDDKGNKLEKTSYNSDGSLAYKYTYKYDDNGNNIEYNRYKSDGSLMFKNKYKYDDKGNQIESNSYTSDGSLIEKVISK